MTGPLVIAYVGNFRPSHSTETHLTRTLEQMGHRVLRIQEDTTSPEMLTRRLSREDMDAFLFTRTWGKTVEMSHLELLHKRGVPSISYHLDLYLDIQRRRTVDRDPFWRTEYVFTPDGNPECQDEFKRIGINHKYMPPGVFAEECYIADVPVDRDVIFVGSGIPGQLDAYHHGEWPYRGQLLGWLRDTYSGRFEQCGCRGASVRGDDLNRLYASTRVSVGDSLVVGFDHKNYWSDRAYEAPGRGAFQIFPWIYGLDEHFKDGETIVFYEFNDWNGLQDRIDYYLKADDEREAIRRAGHEHVKAHHTYTHRLQSMFDVLTREGAL